MSILNWFKPRPKKIGIALSGGAAHGAAHVGVLRVLEREGIRPSVVTGTSAGAIIGAAYAAGVPVEHISQLFQEVRWPLLIRPAFRNLLGLFETGPLENFISENIGGKTFEEMLIPFACVATDLMTGEKIVFNSGPVAEAVRASAAFPGLFAPVQYKDRLLVDGGVVDNLPADIAHDMGADYIIAVDLMSSIKLQQQPGNLIDVLWAVSNLMQIRSAVPDRKLMNCYLRPDVAEFSSWGFGASGEVERRGAQAAEQALPQLRADLKLR